MNHAPSPSTASSCRRLLLITIERGATDNNNNDINHDHDHHYDNHDHDNHDNNDHDHNDSPGTTRRIEDISEVWGMAFAGTRSRDH